MTDKKYFYRLISDGVLIGELKYHQEAKNEANLFTHITRSKGDIIPVKGVYKPMYESTPKYENK